ncbi:MAG TPA: type I 3-dehydroquinate dehydratase [Rickettsiales bacterium]|nr:type I 3-dehydroquinate dehydratase [Rickettsiales bacterium]
MIKICTVVIGNTLDEFLKNLEEIQKISDFVELRVDYIKDFSISDLEIIKKYTYKENIFTCRSIEEGGKFSNNNLLEIIYKANELDFNYIDIEISKLKNIKMKEKNSKIIGSYHNFKETPSYDGLKQIYDEIISFKFVDIAKIATNVINDEDNINLVKIILSKKTDIIVVGMGEKGKITRIISPLIGGYLTFASVGENISAVGQISLENLKNILGDRV